MATYARWQATITDEEGNVLPLAQVRVQEETIGSPLATLFSSRDGSGLPPGNPFNADSDGFAAFHVAGGIYKITATLGSFTRVWRYVAIGTATEYDIEDIALAVATAGEREVTGAGTVTVAPDDRYISINKTVGAATSVVFGLAADKQGDCVIKDGKGDAATNNITITFTGGELCDGLSSVVINTAYDEYRIRPKIGGGAYQLGK